MIFVNKFLIYVPYATSLRDKFGPIIHQFYLLLPKIIFNIYFQVTIWYGLTELEIGKGFALEVVSEHFTPSL